MYESEYVPSSLGVNARQNFVKKVYSILSVQLTVTVAMVLLDYNFKSYGRFQERNNWAFWLAFIGAMVSLIALFFGKISRNFPTNFTVLGIFTLCESYLVTYVCRIYEAESVLLSAVATLAVTLGLTYYAMTTKQDFTSLAFISKGILSSLLWILFSIGIINMLFLRSSFLVMVAAAICSVVYSIYILIDTQQILGGKKREVSLDDYVMGAVVLYVDIIGLFLKILQLIGKKKND